MTRDLAFLGLDAALRALQSLEKSGRFDPNPLGREKSLFTYEKLVRRAEVFHAPLTRKVAGFPIY
jgi:hypothetical protein